MVKIPDPRIERLVEVFEPRKITHAEVEYIDIAGLTSDASTDRKKEAAYIHSIRLAEALLQVVRCFDNSDVPHPDGSVDRIEYGWAQLRYFTSMPTAILVGGSGLVLSEQQTITFTPHPGLGLAVFAVEEGSSDTFVINAGDSAAQVHAVLGFTTMYDPSDITVTGPVNGPYVIEFTSGANVPLISLVGNFFFNPTPVITIEVTQEAGSE